MTSSDPENSADRSGGQIVGGGEDPDGYSPLTHAGQRFDEGVSPVAGGTVLRSDRLGSHAPLSRCPSSIHRSAPESFVPVLPIPSVSASGPRRNSTLIF